MAGASTPHWSQPPKKNQVDQNGEGQGQRSHPEDVRNREEAGQLRALVQPREPERPPLASSPKGMDGPEPEISPCDHALRWARCLKMQMEKAFSLGPQKGQEVVAEMHPT